MEHQFEPTLLWAIALLPLLGFIGNGITAFIAPGRKVIPTLLGPGVVGLAFVIAGLNFLGLRGAELHEPIVQSYWQWMPVGSLSIDAAFQLDQLSLLMALVVTGVGFLIHVFSVGYMHDDAGYARYFSYLNLFVFFMVVLVLGASYPVMFVGWEGVGLCSYLLIGFWFRDREKADAGKKAFIVNRIGDFGFLVAMLLLFSNLGALDFATVFAAAPAAFPYGGAVVTALTLFLFLGATGKSAQIPLYIWLPDAMAGPTPVSALIHAATMVTAGVYMVARSSVLFALAPVSMIVVAGVGAFTALFAATIGLIQYDIKKVLAYSTVSQLGYMLIGVGTGAYAAGIFHLMTHAFFKALLFLGSGAVIHAMHHAYHATHSHEDAQDMRNMGGLRHYLPKTWIFMWIATLAIAGVWPFAGFFSKDEIIWQAAARAVGPFANWFRVYWLLALAAAMLTAFYMTRLMIMTFHGTNRTGEQERRHLHEAPAVMWVPLAVLAGLSVVGGWLNVPQAIKELPVLGWIPSTEWVHEWLHPQLVAADEIIATHVGEATHQAPLGGGEAFWALLSFALATAVILASAAWLRRRRVLPARDSAEPRGFASVLYHKWYVDEIYDLIVVRPVLAVSRFCWRIIDQGLIDGVVNGAGFSARAFGWVGAQLQTGQLNTYAFAAVLGVLLLLGFVIF
ncbi:MAG: NADH-quinone oxidoreductase subunit L [Gemmatimonadetes bacterium]|nr:NADH-quinone oxidoreductase subunit L [Gemmatimonadota bacterium]